MRWSDKFNAKLNTKITEDGQLELSFDVDEGGSTFEGHSLLTRRHTVDIAKAIVAARPDVNWAGFIAELAQKREAT